MATSSIVASVTQMVSLSHQDWACLGLLDGCCCDGAEVGAVGGPASLSPSSWSLSALGDAVLKCASLCNDVVDAREDGL